MNYVTVFCLIQNRKQLMSKVGSKWGNRYQQSKGRANMFKTPMRIMSSAGVIMM